MKLTWITFYHLCCCFLIQATEAALPIGVITDPSTRIGKEQKTAIELAVESFSTNDSVLLLNAIDLNGTEPFQSNLITQDLIQWGAKIVITTGTSQQALVAGTTAGGSKTPIISLRSSLFITGPFTFQISYPESAFVRCIADFVKLHGWQNIITIYEDDGLGLASNTNLLLEDALKTVGSYVEYHAVFSLQDSHLNIEELVESKLRKMMQYESTVYVILYSSEDLALSLFIKAKELNMVSPSYVWICGNDIIDLLNSTLQPAFVANNMIGFVGIKSYINESAEYQDFFSKFRKKYASDYRNNSENFLNPGVHAVRAYDAVNAVSFAYDESIKKSISLVDSLSLVHFEGLSGTIVPKNSTSYNNVIKFSSYQILGIIGETHTILGFWNESSGFNPDMKNLTWLYELIGNQGATMPSGLRMLRVGIPAKPVWKNFVNVETNSTINCSAVVEPKFVTGFCIDVFTKAHSLLKYNVSYQFIAYTTESNSSCNIKSYNDFAGLVQSQEVDLVVGDVTILASRSKVASFTQPFIPSELVMMVATKNNQIGWFTTEPFSQQLWICIACILFCYVLVVWLLERYDRDADRDFRGPIWRQFAASVWLLCNSIFLKIDEGVGSYHNKIVLLWWFLLVQVLLSSFTASLSSILVKEKLNPKVDNLKIGYNTESFIHDYLKSNFNYKPENLVSIDTADEFPVAFKNGTITAAYIELPYLRVLLAKDSNYDVNGESRTLGGFGFIFPKGSPLRDDFSSAILMLQENGMIMKLQRQWFHISLSSLPNSEKQNRQSSLGATNFESLFIFSTCFAILITIHKFILAWWTSCTYPTISTTQGDRPLS